jgi:acyl carrier protein
MISTETVERKLKAIVADVLKVQVDQILPESRFKEDLGADSLDLIMLLYEIEDKLGLTLSDDEALRMKTVADATRLALQMLNP